MEGEELEKGEGELRAFTKTTVRGRGGVKTRLK